MFSEIFTIGPFSLRSYGLFLAIGFLSGIMLAAKRAKNAGQDPDHIYNLSVWIMLSALIGARLYYVVTHYDEYRVTESVSFFTRVFMEFKNMFWPVGANGQVGINGLVLYGGIILSTITTVIYLRRHNLKVLTFLDILAPSLGIGEFFTRIGCFLNGCCFGKPTDSWAGVVFPDTSAAGYYYPHTHIHPAQLYNSLAGLFIFAALLYMERYKKFDGFTAFLYFMLYATGRFMLDFFRHYESSLTVLGLSHNQLLSLAVFVAAGAMMIVFHKRASRNEL